MSIFDGLMGNACQHNNEAVEKKLEEVLIAGESVSLAFKLVRDLIVFTDFRLVLVDKQGVTGAKKLNTNQSLTALSPVFQ